ncbi:MAG: exosortase family protein XrtF [Chryseobacterium sp.]|nr:MAG: exosortase family protein XrtF [Chryseobacterium sp.]
MREFLPVLKILLRFVLIYFALLAAYQAYLYFYESKGMIDPLTTLMAKQCSTVQNTAGLQTTLEQSNAYDGIMYVVRGIYATRMVEGCNAVSIMILFLAFVFAFYKGFKRTLLFAVAGLVILYLLNIGRIVLLNYIAVAHPGQMKPAHDYLFPAIIYGGVVALWLVWVKFFVLKDEKAA